MQRSPQTPDETTTLRVLISSTSIDLQAHRKAVADAILRLGHHPIAMEHFGASSRPPLEVCRERVLGSDVVVVFSAHRYGWVPSLEQRGDGEKSITWYEVEIAQEEGIPVLAYLVDPDHPWSAPKEQDLLVNADSPEAAGPIWQKVQSLKDFRLFLESEAGLTRDTFTTEDDLAKRVTASLAHIQPRTSGDGPGRGARTRPVAPYDFHIYHPLQPATHFHGRTDILGELREWWEDPAHPDRVKSLVAIGGTGKTAIAAEFLRRIQDQRPRAHVFLWSFYEDPNTDSFLYEACAVFAGERDSDLGAGGRLARLERALRDDMPHLFILDGLERVQSAGKAHRAFGELGDHQVKNFLRCIASGLGRTRALVTTRFKMTDLEQWEHAGHRTYDLQHLDEPSAIGVLKAWGVKGKDEKLAALARTLGYHALSVSVLGSYLREFADGDPDQAPNFSVDEASQAGAEGARLARILAGYAQALPAPERDLLVRLAVFPRGVSVNILGYLVHAGGEIAGQLVGADDLQLVRLARKLARLGLVFAYGTGEDLRFTAHPFLRDYFRQLVGVEETQFHEVVRSALAPNLETRPESKPQDKETLDRYEELIEYTLGAGDVETAFDLYWDGMGGFKNLGYKLGEYARGIRILSQFAEGGDPDRISEGLSTRDRGLVANNWGLHALYLGEMSVAERVDTTDIGIKRTLDDAKRMSASLQNFGAFLQRKGFFPQSEPVLKEAVESARKGDDKWREQVALGYLAYTAHLRGQTSTARDLFDKATELAGRPLDRSRGIYEAQRQSDLGALKTAKEQTESNLVECAKNEWNHLASYCHYLLGLLALSHAQSPSEATEHLDALREWADRTGHMEATLNGHHLASEIARASGFVQSALDEAEIGLTLAESCGLGLLAIKLLLSLARAHLDAPDLRAALSRARQALEQSRHQDCGYAWGEADAAHLCGVAHLRLGERDLAKRRFAEALEVRQRIEHPQAEESRHALDKLG